MLIVQIHRVPRTLRPKKLATTLPLSPSPKARPFRPPVVCGVPFLGFREVGRMRGDRAPP